MASNKDSVEWFQMRNPANIWGDPFTHGIVEFNRGWIVVKKEFVDALGESYTKVSEIARVPTREAAIGILKLLKEEN